MDNESTDIQNGSGTSFNTADTPKVETPVTGAKSKLLPGIIGAILGAALGSILWIVLGMFGYISGLAGLAIFFLSMKGYILLSEDLSRKGPILSAVISLLMLVLANYTTYVLTFCKIADAWSTKEILWAYQNLPALLTETDGWRYFYKDLAIGLVLTLIVVAIYLSSNRKRK
jgi:hypothetical protein